MLFFEGLKQKRRKGFPCGVRYYQTEWAQKDSNL